MKNVKIVLIENVKMSKSKCPKRNGVSSTWY